MNKLNCRPAMVLYLVESRSDHVDGGDVSFRAHIGPQVDDQVGERENSQCVDGHVEQVSFHAVRIPV